MLTVSVALMPLVLSEYWRDEITVARYSIIYILIAGGSWLVYYLRQRLRTKSPTPIASALVIIGYVVLLALHTACDEDVNYRIAGNRKSAIRVIGCRKTAIAYKRIVN